MNFHGTSTDGAVGAVALLLAGVNPRIEAVGMEIMAAASGAVAAHGC